MHYNTNIFMRKRNNHTQISLLESRSLGPENVSLLLSRTNTKPTQNRARKRSVCFACGHSKTINRKRIGIINKGGQ